MSTYLLDPNSTLDFAFEWSAWLATGETITAATVTTPAGITQPTAASFTGTKVTAWLSGGTEGVTYPVTCSIATSAGRKEDRTIRVLIAQR